MWVVLTDPSKKGKKWDKDDFFATGRQDVKAALEKLRELGVKLDFNRALDFGCGVGRLSQALGEHFDRVDGVDVSASMIEHARALNRRPEKVTYHLNVKEDLSDFPSHTYSFIFSVISLQHIPPTFQKKYIVEFMRLLKPQGTAFFQTIHSHGWRSLVPHAAADAYRKIRSKGKAFIPLYAIPAKYVSLAAERNSCVITKHECSPYHGHESRYVCDHYVVTKQGPAPAAP